MTRSVSIYVDELHVSLSLAGRANAQTKYDILCRNVYAADICAAEHLPQICKRFTNGNNINRTATATAAAASATSCKDLKPRTKTPAAANGTHENERPIEWARSLRIYFNKRKERRGRRNRRETWGWGGEAALKAIGNYNHVCAYGPG